jgi:hypothetical protein
LSDSSQWYGSVTYADVTASDITAGFAQMERWNIPTSSPGVYGTEQVIKNLDWLCLVVHDKALARLKFNCERILAKSQEQVPVDMTYERVNRYAGVPKFMLKKGFSMMRRGRLKGGWLKSTGTIEPLEGEDGFRIGYNTPYAHRQHEDLTYHHTKSGAKAKYLEDPLWEIAPSIADDITEALKEFL